MRKWNAWLKPLLTKFKKMEGVELEGKELERFFEVEYCLRLHEQLIPQHSCYELWALLTGYQLVGINDTPEARQKCVIARHRVRYLRTATSWTQWLTWYADQPEILRLYDVDLELGRSERRTYVPFVPERLELYDAAIASPAEHRERSEKGAPPGTYLFTLRGEIASIRIAPGLLEQADSTLAGPPMRSPDREPITVSLADLVRVADILHQKDPGGDWLNRAQRLNLHAVEQGQLTSKASEFTIAGLFHLVGMVGAGKTTLIQLLVYHLAVERGLHVTLMLNTVVESIEMAAHFRRLGIAAAPALGAQRGEHRLKYGRAHAARLMPQDLFLPQAVQNAALDWLTGPCLLSGLLTEGGPIPSGEEPCNALFDVPGKRYSCPLRSTCPVHQAGQDLSSSTVWIVNPASFIHSRAPEGRSQEDIRLLEAVYRTSDILIIDEADRVQVQWDHKYAPIDDLVGHKDALLDWLDVTLAQEFAQQGRRQLKQPRNNVLRLHTGEANRFSDHMLHLLFNHPDLVEWILRRPLTNVLIYTQLADELARPAPHVPIDEAVRKVLLQDFEQFYSQPTALGGENHLAQWVNDVRYEEAGRRSLLETWLQERLPWSLKAHPEAGRLIRRLEFSLLLTAMDRRVNEVLRNWLWAALDIGEHRVLDQSPPEEYVDLVPESPLGNLLGYQYVQSNPGGVLKYIQCYGVGRWLLMNLGRAYLDLDGVAGPHVLLTSATSWAPGSPQFHVLAPANAVLTPPTEEEQAIATSTFTFKSIPDKEGRGIRVSGVWGKSREEQLAKLVRYLGTSSENQPSPLDQELQYWRDWGIPRKVLLVVGSYAEAQEAVKTLLELPGWRQPLRAVSLHPDAEERFDPWVIRRGEVENLASRQADVIVAPLLAIQRGFNILDDLGGALLGSVFFLVRPFPVPDDLGQHVIGVNQWAQRLLEAYEEKLPVGFGESPSEMIGELRRRAYADWNRRLSAGQYGLDGLPEDLYRELLWDQFVAVWQTIGRLVRRGRPARVCFVDTAFHPPQGRSMLRGWTEILDEYMGAHTQKPLLEQQLAETLYRPAYQALKALLKQLDGDSR